MLRGGAALIPFSSKLLTMKTAAGHKEDNINWKGDDASYFAKHIWVNSHFTKPRLCEMCGLEKKTMHWANISGKCKRIRSDWKRLCVSCHRKYDYGRGAIHVRGSTHPWARLTEEDVLAIRERYRNEGNVEIAESMGLPYMTVYAITSRRNWKHI